MIFEDEITIHHIDHRKSFFLISLVKLPCLEAAHLEGIPCKIIHTITFQMHITTGPLPQRFPRSRIDAAAAPEDPQASPASLQPAADPVRRPHADAEGTQERERLELPELLLPAGRVGVCSGDAGLVR